VPLSSAHPVCTERRNPLRTADATADRAFANRAVAREFREE